MAKGTIPPARLAPLYWLTTLVHAGSVVTRFDKLNQALPPKVNAAILFVQFPLLLIVGWYEGKIDLGPYDNQDMPLWIRIKPWSLKTSIAMAFAFLCIVITQTWHIGVGPMDPTPPDVWPQAMRLGWFLMFTLGFTGIFMIAAPSAVIPPLRIVTQPFRWAPSIIAVPLLTAVGMGAGYYAIKLLADAKIGGEVASIQATLDLFKQDWLFMIVFTNATVWLPILLGKLTRREAA